MKFNTKYRVHQHFYCSSGSPDVPVFNPIVNENGSVDLKITGKRSLFDEIQASADSCDINLLVKRYEAGDLSALERVEGFYGDFTNSPQSLIDVYQYALNCKTEFYNLSPEVRAEFNNNVDEFVAQAGSPRFAEIYKKYLIKNESEGEVNDHVESEQ